MDATQLVIYLLVSLVAGLLAERLVGAALPGGPLGTVLAALLGIWLMLRVLGFAVPGDIQLGGVPLLTAILGAVLVLAIWILVSRALVPLRSRR